MIEDVISIAKQAGDILLKHLKNGVSEVQKADGSLVSIADSDADTLFVQRTELEKLFPDDTIVSEETESTVSDFSGRVWYVDPLDGTIGFLRYQEGFAVSIGLTVDGVPVLGVIHDPMEQETFFAEAGKGAFSRRNGDVRLVPRQNNTLETAHVRTVVGEDSNIDKRRYENGEYTDFTQYKCYALCMCWVAAGRYDAVMMDLIHNPKKWDSCAGQIILQEAGALYVNLNKNWPKYLQQDPQFHGPYVACSKEMFPVMQTRFWEEN